MMCGPYGVGKTSIVRSLRGEPFNDEYNSTEGIDAVGRVDKHTLGNDLDFKQASRQWIMKNPSLKSNHVELLFEDSKNRRRQDLQSFVVFSKQSSNSHFKKKASEPVLKPSQKPSQKPEENGICITIWDFAGQIEYHCMHQMFFRSNCLYLLVLDLQMDGSGRRYSEKEMLLDAQKWLNAIISSAGPEIGLIVVGTHADAYQSSDAAMDRLEDLMGKLEEMVPDVEYDNVLMLAKKAVVDNKKNVGISQLKSKLYETAERLLSDILVPLSWLRLLEKVREEIPLKDNEICAPLQKIQNLARTIGIMEEDQLCASLSFFDRVGELTYIRERELSDWVFTEPQLLLNAMKSLLVPERNLKRFLQRRQQRELKDYGFLENEALKAIWTQYKNQGQLRHLMAAMGLIIELRDGVAIPCRLPKKPILWEDKPLEKEIVVTTKYSTHLPPSLYGHALAGLLRHHVTPEQELRLLSQTTSCIEIDSSKLFLQNEQGQHPIALRAILQNEQAQHAIALRVRASPASSHMPDETVLKDTLVRTVKDLVSTLHSLERDRFMWMTVQSCVQLDCCNNLREFRILESKRTSESYSAKIAPCQDSFLCHTKVRHSLLDAVQDATAEFWKAQAHSSKSNEPYTDLLLESGKSEHVGELWQAGLEEPQAKWPVKINNFVFISQTGRDGSKEEIARPTSWFLNSICDVKTFLDATDINPGHDKTSEVMQPAYQCTHALVIISPKYCTRRFCVQELNTFMKRRQREPNFRVIPVLWRIDNVDGYHREVDELAWIADGRHNTPESFLLNVLWPKLLHVFDRPKLSYMELKQELVKYIKEHFGVGDMPFCFQRFLRDYMQHTP
jgi:GTPase SAR1 family protein